ncbi:MAG: AMP-binding protein [Victivallales bacterium]|nr:AMP-binding protein [Victivallales bacterium]
MTRLLCFFVRLLVALRYRVRVHGAEEILSRGHKGILLLPNHPALIDPIILMSHLHPRFGHRILADKDQAERPVISTLAKMYKVIEMPDAVKYGSEALDGISEALKECGSCLGQGENVLIYPSGHILRSKHEEIGANSGVETLLSEAPEARVVIVRTKGLWGSCFSRADGDYPSVGRNFWLALRVLAGNLLFFTPRRKVDIYLSEPEDFPIAAGRNEMNRYLEEAYNTDASPNTYIPYYFWSSEKERVIPDGQARQNDFDPSRIPKATRELVENKLIELAGVKSVEPSQKITNDLGMDSISRIDLALWIESEFGFNVSNPDVFDTVADVLLAASGDAMADKVLLLPPPPARWFAQPGKDECADQLCQGSTIQEIFLCRAAKSPACAVMADSTTSGVRSFRDVVMAVILLRKLFEGDTGKYVGIMFPASVAATTLYLAALFHGKIPVMLNWTVGARNLKFMTELLNISRVLTSSRLVAKLQEQGLSFEGIERSFVYLEPLRDTLTLKEKAGAKLKSLFSWKSLKRLAAVSDGDDVAVVLFTSGSESFPKAVPLTHKNIITNIRDVIATGALRKSDSMIGFLPPFHSFGLTLTSILPLLTGLRVFYHPNPTEGGTLAKLIKNYRSTILAGTPTFINGILKGADKGDLDTLRLGVTGAEKCPEQVYKKLEQMCPDMTILEGYGITECSPVVSVNRPDNPVPYSIGKVMDSLEHLVVDESSGKECKPGERGMLLVKGGSVFGGYLEHDGPSPFVEHDGRQFYRTGDLVEETPEGTLFFKGRLKRFIKLGGEMVSMPAVEDVLIRKFRASEDDPAPLAVDAPDGEVPELTLFTVADISREQANKAIKEAGLSPIHNVRKVVKVQDIPILGTGKTDYRKLKALAEK